MSSKSKEMISNLQKGVVLNALHGDINKIIILLGADEISLGRWN